MTEERARGSIVAIGIGNDLAGDDGAGLVAARMVGRAAPFVEVREAKDATDVIEHLDGALAVLLFDAVRSQGAPGHVHRWDVSQAGPHAHHPGSSTHALDVGRSLDIARALGRLPGTVVLYGVEGERFAPGDGLSPAVLEGIAAMVRGALADVASLERSRERGHA